MSAHPSHPLYAVLPDFAADNLSDSPATRSPSGWGEVRRVPAMRLADAALRAAMMDRLQGLYSELCLLLGGGDPDQVIPLMLVSVPVPVIRVGSHGSICVAAETGRFTFVEGDDTAVFITRSKERMVAHVVGYILRTQSGLGPRSAQSAIPALVGMGLRDVELALVLETLLHCRGNSQRAASMLGVSVGAMRVKLRALWDWRREEGE